MPENHAGQRLLPRCFNLEELDFLQQQTLFQKAIAKMKTLTDFEKVAVLGRHLLTDRDRVQAGKPTVSPVPTENEVHIRSKTTRSYWGAAGGWAVRRVGARNFLTVAEARAWCAQEGLVNIEIVVYRDEMMCMSVPLV